MVSFLGTSKHPTFSSVFCCFLLGPDLRLGVLSNVFSFFSCILFAKILSKRFVCFFVVLLFPCILPDLPFVLPFAGCRSQSWPASKDWWGAVSFCKKTRKISWYHQISAQRGPICLEPKIPWYHYKEFQISRYLGTSHLQLFLLLLRFQLLLKDIQPWYHFFFFSVRIVLLLSPNSR